MRSINKKKSNDRIAKNSFRTGKVQKRSIVSISRPSSSIKLPFNESVAPQMLTRSKARLLNTIKDGIQLIQFHSLTSGCKKKSIRLSTNNFSLNTNFKRAIKQKEEEVVLPQSSDLSPLVMTLGKERNGSAISNGFEGATSFHPELIQQPLIFHNNKTNPAENNTSNLESDDTLKTIQLNTDINVFDNKNDLNTNNDDIDIKEKKTTVKSIDHNNQPEGKINLTIKEDDLIDNHISSLVKQELWKKEQLYNLQKNVVKLERQKLDVFKSIFSKLKNYLMNSAEN